MSEKYYTSLVKDEKEKEEIVYEEQPWISANVKKKQGRRFRRYRSSTYSVAKSSEFKRIEDRDTVGIPPSTTDVQIGEAANPN